MEYAAVKLFLIVAFFVTLLSSAYWAGDNLKEYKDYWKEEEGEDNESG